MTPKYSGFLLALSLMPYCHILLNTIKYFLLLVHKHHKYWTKNIADNEEKIDETRCIKALNVSNSMSQNTQFANNSTQMKYIIFF